jgi:hypothetical protein
MMPVEVDAVSLDAQIRSVKREVLMRQNVFPRWVALGRMKQADAERELRAMQAVVTTLERLEAEQRPSLF